MAANVTGLIHLLKAGGATWVVAVLTASATRFVTAESLRFVGGADEVLTDASPEAGPIPNHIRLMETSDLVVVYPASAGFLGRISHGLADDLASLVVLGAGPSRTLLFPSTNAAIWINPAVCNNINTLESFGYSVNHCGDGFPIAPDRASAMVLEHAGRARELRKNGRINGNQRTGAGAGGGPPRQAS